MRKTSDRRNRGFLVTILLLFICSSCRTDTCFSIREYLNVLAWESGIADSQEEDAFGQLVEWGVIEENDAALLDDALDFAFLSRSICNLLQKQGDPLDVLKREGYLSEKRKEKDRVSKEVAMQVIVRAVKTLNNRSYKPLYETIFAEETKSEEDAFREGGLFLSNGQWKTVGHGEENSVELRDASFEEVFEAFHLESSSPVDFSKAVVIAYGDVYEDSSYINEKYTLLSESDNHVFYKNGFRISYTLNPSGIDFHISKNKNGLNIYLDISLRNLKPELSWHEEKNDLKNCFFALKFSTTEKFGVSSGRYRKYRIRFRDLDASSFRKMLSTLLEPLNENEEAEFPVCTIRIPMEHLPGVFLCLDLKVRLHASGKGEFVLCNTHQLGFETRNGKIRYIRENSHDLSGVLQATAKAVLGINLGVEAAGFSLADVELEGGVRGIVRTTAHFYDKDGNVKSEETKIPYDGMNELSEGNSDVLVCGDLSLNWLLDLVFNTKKTQMNRFGFSRSLSLMDEEFRLFGGKHHIENGHFVEKCTRKKRDFIKEMEYARTERIVLDSYAEVLRKGESYRIAVKSLPEGYSENDLVFESGDPLIASVHNGEISAVSSGSTRISVMTKDGRHQAYVNILVSTQ